MTFLKAQKGVLFLGGAKMIQIGENAKRALIQVRTLSEETKTAVLETLMKKLKTNSQEIIKCNKIDLEQNGYSDRLMLNTNRIDSLIESINRVISMKCPVGEISEIRRMPNGLEIGKMTTPLGVVGIIYEARPNVTLDGFLLCFKTNNVSVLRGGKEAIESNMSIVKIIRECLVEYNLDPNIVQLIEDTTRQSAIDLMKLSALDVLIPRGGKGLIQSVIENAEVPVIETGVGNCHIYVDEYADLNMALKIASNAKMSRISVCNSAETFLVHRSHADEFIKNFDKSNDCKIYGCERTQAIINCEPVSDVEYRKEFLDYKVAIRVVESFEEAIEHINAYSTNHSEAIVTMDYNHSQRFLKEVDSACVYINASTRFSDGVEFGLGAEIGISTQKLHARGPMGLKSLTTYKYIVYGQGQIRE